MRLSEIINELKRRDVFRVATAYAVTSWLIIQVIVSVFPYLGIDDFWITTIIVLLIIGFPVSIIAGWIYEMTPDGIRKTDEVEVSEEFDKLSDRKLNQVIIGVLATVIVFMVVERLFFAEGRIIERDTLQVQTASVAVLPFVDMSENQDQEYFSDGLSEELLNVLAKVEGLKVAGRTSSFQFKGDNQDLRKIGSELGVDHVLEGSVRKYGNQIRVTAQLIKTEDGFHVWSETFQRDYSANDLFQIQDEISSEVLQELEVRLIPEKRAEISQMLTSNTAALDDYLKAIQLLSNRKATEINESILLLDKVILEDDQFAEAYARRAIAYDLLGMYGNIKRKEMLEKMRLNIDRALLINPQLGLAYAALGLYHTHLDNFDEARIALQKAHELLPGNPEVMIWYSQVADSWSLSEQLINRAYEADPFNALALDAKARLLYDEDEFEEAVHLMEVNITRNPENSLALSLKAEFLRDQPFGKLDEAFILAYQAYLLEPGNMTHKFNLAEMSFDLGFYFLAEQMRNELREDFSENFSLLELKFDYFLYTQQYDSMRVVMQQVVDFEDTDPSDYALFEPFMFMYLTGGWYEEAENYLIDNFPDLSTAELNEFYYLEDLALASELFRKLNKPELAQPLGDVVCNEAESYFTFGGDLKREIVQDLMDYMDCVSVRRDKSTFLEVLEEIHFERKSKANLYTFLDANPVHDFIKQDADYLKLRDRMEADIAAMRENAKRWLQENGHWKNDWQITLVNYSGN
jgi:TolB-like protein/Tfp pilus assembly protein PilF